MGYGMGRGMGRMGYGMGRMGYGGMGYGMGRMGYGGMGYGMGRGMGRMGYGMGRMGYGGMGYGMGRMGYGGMGYGMGRMGYGGYGGYGRFGGYGYGRLGGYGRYGGYGMGYRYSPIGYGYGYGRRYGPYGYEDEYATGESYGYLNELGASRDYQRTRGVGYYSPTMGRLPGRFGDDITTLVQGGSLRTWTYKSQYVEQVQVVLTTEGRPLDADVQLWQGPDNTPVKMRVYNENGALRPFSCVIDTPRTDNTVAVRNLGQIEFPIEATVIADTVDVPSVEAVDQQMTIQGSALRTFPFDSDVDSVQVLLSTDGRPLNARIELLQGPNNNKQVIELYTDDGLDRPFFCFLATPGSGNVVRVVNTGPVEFPLIASVVPNTIGEYPSDATIADEEAVVSGNAS
jgi:hypothetical protein